MVRLRFAPSPTGYLHVGGLRTALFCWLYTRKNSGKFIFRLEDTDQKRIFEGAENQLTSMLEWSGIEIDEGPQYGGIHGPYRQSERLDIYAQYIRLLLDEGNAYRCFCTSERLEKLRNEQRKKGNTPRYDGFCRNLSKSEASRRAESGEDYVVRMKIPEVPETMVLNDLIRGIVSIETSQSEDQVIVKSDGFPTYHLAVVIDDYLMKITHVVRGEEWIPSFPKHLLLYRYFGWDPPQFAHLPLILNPDRSKLSKRQGDVAVEDFRNNGFLPESLVNFVAMLGWSPGEDKELFTLPELIREFSFERVNKSGAIFDQEKLNWMNSQYIKTSSDNYITSAITTILSDYCETNMIELETPITQDAITTVLDILKERVKTINPEEMWPVCNFFFETPEPNEQQRLLVKSKASLSSEIYEEAINTINSIEEGIRTMNIALAMKKSAKMKKMVQIKS